MMSEELKQIFILFTIGLISGIISWLAWTRKQFTVRFTRYRCEDSPFTFWLYLTSGILGAVLFTLMGIVYSISLLRSSFGW
jgi:hypothetical protein